MHVVLAWPLIILDNFFLLLWDQGREMHVVDVVVVGGGVGEAGTSFRRGWGGLKRPVDYPQRLPEPPSWHSPRSRKMICHYEHPYTRC